MNAHIARAGVWAALVAVSAAASAGEPAVRYPYRVAGVCPFECCQYGTWTARSDIPVVAEERARASPAFTIRTGEEFEAIGGTYWTLAPFIVKPRKAVDLPFARILVPAAADRAVLGSDWTRTESVPLPAGTEIHVLVNLGEGAQVGLAAGKPVALDASMYESEDSDFVATKRGGKATEWWIEVKSGARHGWFERGKHQIEGSDACE